MGAEVDASDPMRADVLLAGLFYCTQVPAMMPSRRDHFWRPQSRRLIRFKFISLRSKWPASRPPLTHAREFVALALVLFFTGGTSRGAISGINASGSFLITNFDDTGSVATSGTGVTNANFVVNPWSGALTPQPAFTDPNTGDSTSGFYFAFSGGNSYAVFLNSVQVNHQLANTGSATLTMVYGVEFQCNALGLPLAPISLYNYAVTGNIQPGGFATFNGVLTYTSAALGLLDQVNYAYLNTTPGPFFATVSGTPTSGAPFTLPANDTITLNGQFQIIADPASITVSSVPEPSTYAMALAGLACGGYSMFRRRKRA